MITGELKNKIDSLWDIFAAGGLVNPLDVIEQITYLMFIHDLDDTDNLRAKEAAMLGLPYQSIFADEVQVGDRTIDGQQLKWSVFHDFPAGKMYSVMQEWVFPFIKNLHGDKNSAYSKYMDDAIFKLPTPLLLSKVVDALDEIYRLMSESEAARLSAHFRSKVEEARRHAKDNAGMVSFYQVMKETLDYRRWFEFQLFSQKSGERVKELTNSVFGTFSGGEKAMSMYVPLFSAVVAKYQGGRADAPRLISLDEAFAGVDNRNIRDMFRLMTEFSFDFIINSQVLWGDCDTLDALAIYQLIRPENAKFVTVIRYTWNGTVRQMTTKKDVNQTE